MKNKFSSSPFCLILCILAALAAFVASFTFSANAQSGDPLPGKTGPILVTGTTPINGTNEVQTITIGGTPTGGTFTLSFKGKTTGAVSWSSTNSVLVANIDGALEGLATVGTNGVTTAVATATNGIGTYTVTFGGNLAKLDVPVITASSSLSGTSPTLAIATTTPGITADGRRATKGELLLDLGTPKLYINASGTSLQPNWTAIGPN